MTVEFIPTTAHGRAASRRERPRPGIEGMSSDAPRTLQPPRFTLAEWWQLVNDVKDTSYRRTRLGRDVVAYLAWKRLSRAAPRTLDQYERDLRLICLAVNCGCKNVTHGDLMLVLQVVPEGSWKRVRAAWNDFFRWAVREGVRPDNPVDRLPKLRPTPQPVYEIWSQPELDMLVSGTRRMEHPLRERLRVLTMIETGARAGELRGIQLEHIDLYRRTVKVLGKGSKQRRIPISEELVRTVDEYLLTPYPLLGRDPVLADYLWYPVWRVGEQIIGVKPERPLSYRGFHAWWCRVEAAAGVRHRRPHMTRHTFATDLLDATEGDLYAVRELLGHASTRTTEGYLHSTRKRTTAAIDALAAYRESQR
jgi:integrase/recombinase XerC